MRNCGERNQLTGRRWRPSIERQQRPLILMTTDAVRDLYRCTDLTRVTHLDIRDEHLVPCETYEERRLLDSALQNVTDVCAGDNHLNLDVFARLPAIRQLELQNNCICNVPVFSGGSFRRLEVLDVSANDITNDCIEALSSLPVLMSLNIAYNSLTAFAFHNPTGFRGLQRLNLSGNRLTSGGLADLTKLSQLTELNLSRNQLTSAALLSKPDGLANLCHLDLSYNRITEGRELPQLPSLRLLRLVGNSFSTVQQAVGGSAFRKLNCQVLFSDTNSVELSTSLSAKRNEDDRCLVRNAQMAESDDNSKQQGKSQPKCGEVEYKLTDDELADIVSNWKTLPRPSSLHECNAILNDLLLKPRASVAGLIPRKIQTKFPLTQTKQLHKAFWQATEECRDKMDRNWTRKDRVSDAVPGALSVKRRKTMTNRQIVKRQLKKYNLEKAMENVLQIDETVFRELLAYRKRIRDNRETVYELEEVLEDFYA